MYSLHDGQMEIQGTGDLLSHATDYYRKLFGTGEGDLMQFRADVWSVEECLNLDEVEELIKPFTEKEIKNAIDQMLKYKAPGPDGIPFEFYQACWPIIKTEVLALFDDWFHGKIGHDYTFTKIT